MTATDDDERIEGVIRTELEEGRKYMERAGLHRTKISMHRHPRTDVMLFEVGGRYPSLPDRDVYATVEVDPARVGWSLEATLWEYPDSEDHDREVQSLGEWRVETVDAAAQSGRVLATASWVAVRDYIAKGGQSGRS